MRETMLVGSLIVVLRVSAACTAEARPESVESLRADIAALRLETETQIAEIRRTSHERINALEAAVARITAGVAPMDAYEVAARKAGESHAPASLKTEFSGDVRIRYESTSASASAPQRDRGVLRARLGARYDATKWLAIGGRLVTGDPDDPNSTDVTLSDFADDLSMSLDLAYTRMHWRDFEVYAGKIPNPFSRTELVWDGDVNPAGLSGSWTRELGAVSTRLTALYFLINEQASGPESDMAGLQLGLASAKWQRWKFELAGAYYTYELAGLAGADADDVRSNLLTLDGTRYLSDFDLADFFTSATFTPTNNRWPVGLVANYIRNMGAVTSADTGYSLELLWGRANGPGDLRIAYGYSLAEADAVLAAFSHDNTTLATNYRQHTLGVDYVLAPNTFINGTWYRYRPDQPGVVSAEHLDRIRLNFMLQF